MFFYNIDAKQCIVLFKRHFLYDDSVKFQIQTYFNLKFFSICFSKLFQIFIAITTILRISPIVH